MQCDTHIGLVSLFTWSQPLKTLCSWSCLGLGFSALLTNQKWEFSSAVVQALFNTASCQNLCPYASHCTVLSNTNKCQSKGQAKQWFCPPLNYSDFCPHLCACTSGRKILTNNPWCFPSTFRTYESMSWIACRKGNLYISFHKQTAGVLTDSVRSGEYPLTSGKLDPCPRTPSRPCAGTAPTLQCALGTCGHVLFTEN